MASDVGDVGGYPKELLESAEALTRFVAADHDFPQTMQRLSELAVHAIDGAEHCSISLATPGGPDLKTVAASGDVAYKIDDLQKETDQGPCRSSIKERAIFRIPDMSEDDTWPEFSRRAREELGVNSMVSYVLRLAEDATGAMNMISSKEDAFTSDDIDNGTIFAAQAAIAMSSSIGHRDDKAAVVQLEEGMKTRQMIGQAVGILMATRRLDAEEAFEVLKNVSQSSNIKLRDIAQRVVEKPPDM